MQIFSLDPTTFNKKKIPQRRLPRIKGFDRRDDYDEIKREMRDDDSDGNSDRSRSRSPGKNDYIKWDAEFDQVVFDQKGIQSPRDGSASGSEEKPVTKLPRQKNTRRPIQYHESDAPSHASFVSAASSQAPLIGPQLPSSSGFIGPLPQPSREHSKDSQVSQSQLSQASQETANSDLANELERDLMEIDDDPPLQSSSATSSGSAFGYGKSAYKSASGKSRFGNSVLNRYSNGSGSRSRSSPSNVINGQPPRPTGAQAQSRAFTTGFDNKIISNLHFDYDSPDFQFLRSVDDMQFCKFACRYAESPDHSRSRSRTREDKSGQLPQYVFLIFL